MSLGASMLSRVLRGGTVNQTDGPCVYEIVRLLKVLQIKCSMCPPAHGNTVREVLPEDPCPAVPLGFGEMPPLATQLTWTPGRASPGTPPSSSLKAEVGG